MTDLRIIVQQHNYATVNAIPEQMIDTTDDLTDEELAHQSTTDAEAFGLLIERYQDKLLRYIMRKSAVGKEGAEDLLQESFIKAYQSINSFDTSLSFSSWIYRIVHNTTVSQWRKSNVRPEGHSVEVDDEFLHRIMDDSDLVADIDQEFLAKNIDKVLVHMPEKYREVLVLRFMEDKDYAEIADILKKPMGTIATLLYRAKAQFKKHCEDLDQPLS